MITLDKDEHIIYEIRKHWLVFVSEILLLVIAALLPLFLYAFIPQINEFILFKSTHNNFANFMFLTIFYSFFLFILWNIAFIMWTDYYLDVWIVTNKRIVDVEQKGLFVRELASLYLDRVQDVTFNINGLIATYFDIGTIQVQTAGEEKLFIISGVGKPAHIHEQLNNAIQKHKTSHVASLINSINNNV